MELAAVFALVLVLLLAGVPVYLAMGLPSLLYFLSDGLPGVAATSIILNGVNSFPLIAIPFFIFAGLLMNEAGVTDRIFRFARTVVGWAPGGLGHVNIASSVIFAGMSGAAVADAGGLGAVEVKAMRDAGYDRDFAVGVTAASSTIGPIIPPSLPLIIYAVLAEVSVGSLFAAGLLPGLLMALVLMAMVAWYAKRRGYPRETGFSGRHLLRATIAALLPLLAPIIIVGGIISGMFTPTEAAIAAVVYVLLIGSLVYRDLSLDQVRKVAIETVETTATVLMIVAAAALFGWVLTANNAADALAGLLLGASENPRVVLAMIMVLVFVTGFFLETVAAITLLTPLVLPVALAVGIDPVHLGVIMILNLMIGLLTPPVGMVLYVLARVSKTPFADCVRATAPFIVPLVGVLILLMFFPGLALWLPGLLSL